MKMAGSILRGVRVGLRLLLLSLTCFPAWAQTSPSATPVIGQISDVICGGDPSQSYSLFLPTTYSPAKRWPIIYFFDPGGRGRRPLELYKNLGETYGFIFAGSNNSRNFSPEQSKSLNAIWVDTHERLSLDERRIYTSGFSGGARVAGAMALTCPKCQIAGVVAHGAGYPSNLPSSSDKLLYYFAIGDHDFNWAEVMNIRREREDHGLPYRVRVYPGPHQWAPPEVMEDAIQWLLLKAIQRGDLPADPAFVESRFQSMRVQVEQADKSNDALARLATYRSLVSDFGGLKDTSEVGKKLSALKDSKELKAALKAERDQIEEQYSLEREISPKLRAYADGSADDPNALRVEIVQAIGRLNQQAEHGKNEARRLVASRALEDIWVEGIESGQQELEARHYEKAATCFELMSEVRKSPWPFLLLAETHASAGKRNQAIRDLQQAVRLGLTDAGTLENDRKLEDLKGEAEFQKLVAGLKQK